MKARVYIENRKEFKNYADPVTVYFPYPKRLWERERAKGYYIACNFTSSGLLMRLHSDTVDVGVMINGNRCHFGRRLHDKDIPAPALKEIKALESAWNRAVSEDTDEAWDAWNEA